MPPSFLKICVEDVGFCLLAHKEKSRPTGAEGVKLHLLWLKCTSRAVQPLNCTSGRALQPHGQLAPKQSRANKIRPRSGSIRRKWKIASVPGLSYSSRSSARKLVCVRPAAIFFHWGLAFWEIYCGHPKVMGSVSYLQLAQNVHNSGLLDKLGFSVSHYRQIIMRRKMHISRSADNWGTKCT